MSGRTAAEWFDQVTGEVRRVRYVRNRPVIEFTPKRRGQQVEALDALCYAWGVRQSPAVKAIDLRARAAAPADRAAAFTRRCAAHAAAAAPIVDGQLGGPVQRMSAARVKLLRSSSAQVEMRVLADLKPYPGNARTHSARQVKQIARSMRQWGFTIPILIDEDDMILAGHGRKLAAERLKLEEAPCLVARGWSDAQKKAYVIADNKLAENARWDDDLLIAEITALREEDPTIDLVIGFDERELDKLAEDIAERAAPKLKGLNYSIVVRCEGELQQRELLAAFEEQGLKCEALIA